MNQRQRVIAETVMGVTGIALIVYFYMSDFALFAGGILVWLSLKRWP